MSENRRWALIAGVYAVATAAVIAYGAIHRGYHRAPVWFAWTVLIVSFVATVSMQLTSAANRRRSRPR